MRYYIVQAYLKEGNKPVASFKTREKAERYLKKLNTKVHLVLPEYKDQSFGEVVRVTTETTRSAVNLIVEGLTR